MLNYNPEKNYLLTLKSLWLEIKSTKYTKESKI